MSPLQPPPDTRRLARIALRRVVAPAAPPPPPAWKAFDELAALVGLPPISAGARL